MKILLSFFMLLAFVFSSYDSCFSEIAKPRIRYGTATALNTNLEPDSIRPGQEAKLTITGGVGPYKISKVSNGNIQLNQTGAGSFRIVGVRPGETEITVVDSRGQSKVVQVKVAESLPLNAQVNPDKIRPDQEARLSVSGGTGPYRIARVNNGNIQINQVAADGFRIVGRLPGETDITVQDSRGQSKTVRVTVEAMPLSATISRNDIEVGGERASVVLSGGIKPYSLQSSNNAIVQVQQIAENSFLVYGKSPGTTFIIFRDAVEHMTSIRLNVKAK